jgi:tetratricopeptide (TPR) repeat protein
MPMVSFSVRGLSLGAVIAVLLLGPACSKDPAARKQAFLQSGNKYFDAGQYRHAIIEYRNAVQIDPTFGAARVRLAEAYVRTGEPALALDEYVRAADLLPGDLEVQLQAGTYLLAARQPQDALGRAEVALKLQPKDARVHVLHGNALAGLSSFDKALAAIEEAIRLDPARGWTYAQLGAIELARGRRQEAEAAFSRAVSVEPKSIDAHLALGNFYWATGQTAETEAAFTAALKLDPDSQSANRAMAALSIASGKPERAEPYLRRIAEIAKDPTSVMTLAEYYMLTGRPKEAIARLEPLAAQPTPPADIQHRLARAHAAAGDRPKAHALIAEITKQNPRDAKAQFIKGQLLVADGQRDAALEMLRSAVRADPASVEAQYALGQLYAVRGDVAGAVGAFREVLRLNPQAAAAQAELARLQLAAGNPAESVRNADEARRNDPRNPGVRIALVRALLANRDFDRAERELAPLRKDFPKVAAIEALVGSLAVGRKDFAAARAAFERTHALDPASLEGLAGLIAMELQARNVAGARALVEARLAAGTPTPQLLLLAARTYTTANDLTSAERVLRQAISVDASFLPAYALLGQLYVQQQRLDEARAEFEQLARRQSRPVGAMTMSGMILQAQGNAPKAKQRYQEVLAVDSRAAVAANNLAWMYADSGEKLDEALKLAQTATEAMPDVPEMMDTLGWVYYKKNLPQLAIPLFSRSIEKAPQIATYHYHLGLAYRQAGDAARARTAFRKALEHSPDAETAGAIKQALIEIPEVPSQD